MEDPATKQYSRCDCIMQVLKMEDNKIMERILCLLLTFCLTFGLAACGSDGQQDGSGQDAAGNGESITQPAENGEDGASDAESTEQENGSVSDESENKADAEESDKADKNDKTDKNSKKDTKKDTQTSAKPASNKKPANSGSSSNSSKPASKPVSKPSVKPAADKTDAKAPKSALNLLNTIWDSYKEEEKFPAAGGDFSEANAKDDAPGKFSISDKDALESTLAVPDDAAGKLSSAASLTHMMNLNTFTAASFKIKDKSDVKDFAKAMKNSIETRRWLCGLPDKFVIITVDRYVVSVFGAADLVDTFKSKTLKAYSGAKVYCEENVA